MSPKYKHIQEEELKNKVAHDWFSIYDTTQIIGKIDFCIAMPRDEADLFEPESLLWAEAKAGVKKDIYESFVQLILTIGKGRTLDEYAHPDFLGAFDAEKIAFIHFDAIGEIFSQNDFNWNVTPSNHTTKEFRQVYDIVKSTIGEFYQFNLSSCIRQQNSLTAQFVSFSLANLANIFYPPRFLQ